MESWLDSVRIVFPADQERNPHDILALEVRIQRGPWVGFEAIVVERFESCGE